MFGKAECHYVHVQLEDELARVLPADIPHRDRLITKAAQHLRLVSSANEYTNLTRITNPHEAVIKHVYDSVAPWRYLRDFKKVLDAGTGAGFPGIPLAIVLPETRFTLSESVQKKARFVDSVAEQLILPNVHVLGDRAEVAATAARPDVIVARAVAPIRRLLDLFRKVLMDGTSVILYKGPNVDDELAEAARRHYAARLLCAYELPDGLGSRTVIELKARALRR